MTRKLMTSAFALTAVLALGAIPAAALAHDDPVHPGVEDSYNDNSKTATDSFNDNSSDSSTKNSNNDNSKTLDVAVTDSYNDNSTNDSNDNNSKELAYDSYNATDSYNDNSDNSDNSNNSTNTLNVRVALSLQDLDATVSGIDFTAGSDHHDGGSINTGDIVNDGGAFAGFAGIQTASNNTGFASNNQAATAISANANVTFGNGGGH